MKHLFAVLVLLAAPQVALGQTQSETVEYYGQDAIGSIRIMWDANGNVLGRHDYAPFGQPLFQVAAMPPEGFGAQGHDAELDAQYLHARIFDPRTGRFYGIDPVFNRFSNSQRWNRYAYALNNPLSITDFRGLDPQNGKDAEPVCPIGFFCSFVFGKLPQINPINPTLPNSTVPGSGTDNKSPGNRPHPRDGHDPGNHGTTPPDAPHDGGDGQNNNGPLVIDTPKPGGPKPTSDPTASAPTSLKWGACFGLGVVLAGVPIETGIVAGCAGTTVGAPVCIIAAHEAAAPALDALGAGIAGICGLAVSR